MTIYYATFMQRQATKNHFIMITADNEEQARDAMFEHFGNKWMTVYEEDGFEKQIIDFKLSELLHIRVINHGCREHESLEYKLEGKTNDKS